MSHFCDLTVEGNCKAQRHTHLPDPVTTMCQQQGLKLGCITKKPEHYSLNHLVGNFCQFYEPAKGLHDIQTSFLIKIDNASCRQLIIQVRAGVISSLRHGGRALDYWRWTRQIFLTCLDLFQPGVRLPNLYNCYNKLKSPDTLLVSPKTMATLPNKAPDLLNPFCSPQCNAV